jgi:hypothetical protein
MLGQQADAVLQAGQRVAEGIHPEVQTPETAGAATIAGAQQANANVGPFYGRVAARVKQWLGGDATPAAAGDAILGHGRSRVRGFDEEADMHYGRLRDIENLPENRQTVQVGTKSTPSQMVTSAGQPVAVVQEPVMADLQLPADLRAAKKALQSFYEQFSQDAEWPIIRQQQGPRAAGMRAIEQLVTGPDAVSLSQAERMLSAIKRVAREHGGVAKIAVAKMEQAVARAVAKAGPEAEKALEAGRAATRAKYAVQDVLDLFEKSGEPVGAFKSVTANADAAVTRLEQVAREIPEAIPVIARAMVGDIFASMIEGGRVNWENVRAAASRWDNLGDRTKAILIPNSSTRQLLDSYFRRIVLKSEDMPGAVNIANATEPIRVYNALVQQHDASARALMAIDRAAPGTGRMLGRAWLHEQLGLLGESAGQLSHTKRVLANFRNLGPQTRGILFGSQAEPISRLIQLADDVSYVGNTSKTAYFTKIGTAMGLALHDPLGGGVALIADELGQSAFEKLMWSEQGSRLLEKALTTAETAPDAAVAKAGLWNYVKKEMPTALKPSAVAGAVTTPTVRGVQALPMAAQQQPPAPQPPTAQNQPQP